MRAPAVILSGLIATLALAPALALPPLEQLEARIDLSPTAQLAERSYEATRESLGAARIGLGVSAFGNVGYAHNHEIIDLQRSWTYNQTLLGGGLSMPLLGSRLQLEDSLSDRQVQLLQLDARRQLERRELLGRLRRAYADYWQAQRLQLLARDYLQDGATFARASELRTRAGLMLDADRLELLGGFSLARRDEASAGADREVAVGRMRELTGADLDGGIAVRPLVSTACARELAADDTWMQSDPELLALQKVVALRAVSPRDSPWYPVRSSVQLGYQSLEDVPPGQHGSAAVLSWTFQVPLEYRAQRRLLSRAAAAQLSHARLEYEMRRDELAQQRRELIARASVLDRSTDFAATQLASADAAVEEHSLRAASLDGDVSAQLQKARLQRYDAAKALIEADKARVYWYADWARFGAACEPAATAAVAPAAVAPPVQSGSASAQPPAGPDGRTARRPDRALYVWRSADWLANASAGTADRSLEELHSAGIGRLWVSLDAAQLQEALAAPQRLVDAVRYTRDRAFRVGLLLADPAWIRADQRGRLLGIIGGLKSVPFDGLHLDLEPAQLDPSPARLPALLASLARTLAAVSAASPWPVALSIHPRDLDVQVGQESFAQILQRLRVSPTLMVYVANPDRAVAIARPLLERYPQLSFRVALSLEKSPALQGSLWAYPQDERRRRIERVESGLASANFQGLAMQLEDAWGTAAALAGLEGGG